MVLDMSLEMAGDDGRFRPGENAYQRRKAEMAAIRQSIESTFDFSSPLAATYLTTIVLNVYDSSHARKKTDRTRAANVARRLLRDIPKRQALLDGLLP
jgi:hypothetical protein